MKILPGIHAHDLALVYKENLILGDVQLGHEEALEGRGLLLPRFQLKDILQRLEKIFAEPGARRVRRVIINGDLKHEFGTITTQEWRDALQLFDYLLRKVKEVVVIRGNHDMVLGPVAAKRDIRIVERWEDNLVTIVHGHVVPLVMKNVVIIGHEHPCISFPEKPHEKFKCYLVGSYKEKKLVVMPSFTSLTMGSDITSAERLSPFLQCDLGSFSCYVVDDEGNVRFFGKVKDVERL